MWRSEHKDKHTGTFCRLVMIECHACFGGHPCRHTPILPQWEAACASRSSRWGHHSRTHEEPGDLTYKSKHNKYTFSFTEYPRRKEKLNIWIKNSLHHNHCPALHHTVSSKVLKLSVFKKTKSISLPICDVRILAFGVLPVGPFHWKPPGGSSDLMTHWRSKISTDKIENQANFFDFHRRLDSFYFCIFCHIYLNLSNCIQVPDEWPPITSLFSPNT